MRGMVENSETIVPHICVCICTFKRLRYLERLLKELRFQETAGKFTYSVVITDNDAQESARPLAEKFRQVGELDISYCVEPRQNISLARNRAIEQAKGEYVVFIDDDEFPTPTWLRTLYATCEDYHADGALGPVKPWFETEPPAWVVRAKLHDRPSYPTGLVIDWKKGRTGNTLLKRKVFTAGELAFRPEFLTGEDQDFFRRKIAEGYSFVWCDEAFAYEHVPVGRCKLSFFLRRALFRGKVSLEHPTTGKLEICKSVVALPLYGFALPFLLIAGQHWFVKYLIKTFDHAGRLLACLGFEPVKEVYVSE
jgi:succinoglycan biosynthesis protein ExoM